MSSKSAASAAAQEKAGAAVAKQGKSLLRASMEEVHADARANAMDLASPLATHDSASSVSSPPSITRRPSVHFGARHLQKKKEGILTVCVRTPNIRRRGH